MLRGKKPCLLGFPLNALEQRARDELLASAIFELNKPLFITTVNANEQQDHPISTLLHMLVMDIHQELEDLHASQDANTTEHLSQHIKTWLNALNQRSVLPLAMHMKLLKELEPYWDSMPQDMRLLALRAFKSGILHLRDKALHDPALFPDLVHFISVSVSMATRLLYDDYALHLPTSEMHIRQTFEMARLGLVLTRTLPPQNTDATRLKQALVHHELLRCIDMFSLTDKQQRVVRKRLVQFASYAEVEYVAAGQSLADDAPPPYLITMMRQPQAKSHISAHDVTPLSTGDRLVIPMATLVQRLGEMVHGVSIAEKLLFEVAESYAENDAASFLLCAAIVVNALKPLKHKKASPRQTSHRTVRVRVAFIRSDGLFSLDPEEQFKTWQTIDESKHGMLITAKEHPFPVTSLIEVEDEDERRFALVRWYQASLQGDIRCGVQFVTAPLVSAKVRRVHYAHPQSPDKYWQSLLEQTAQGWNVWLGNWRGVPMPMTVAIKREQQAEIVCRITPTGMIGFNYAVFSLTDIVSQHTDMADASNSAASKNHRRVMVLPDVPE